jgi:pilus assembly protein CpaF
MTGDRVRTEVRSAVARLVEEQKAPLSLVEKDRVFEEILAEVFGLGPLEPLLADPTVSAILVTTPHLLYVERASKLYRTPVEFKDDAHLLRITLKRSCRALGVGWTNPRRWWMPACPTARV